MLHAKYQLNPPGGSGEEEFGMVFTIYGPCVQQASCLEGGPLLWIWPLYLHVNQKSDDDDGQGCHLSNVTWTKYKFSFPLCLEAAFEI